jgi:cytochrome P450 family 130
VLPLGAYRMVSGTFVYDPAGPRFQDEMYDVYRVMRDEYPVYRSPEGTYALSRFIDVWDGVHDPQTFSSDCVEAGYLMPQMVYFDPPRHTALRLIVSRAFTPRRIAELETRIREIARSLIDRIDVDQEFDLVREFAAPLPSSVMCELLGVPDAHREDFRSWTEAFLELTSPADIATRADNIYGLFGELLAARRVDPQDDLISALLAAEVDGERLSEDDLLGFCFLLLIAGNDTTTVLIGNGTELLARHPDQRALLVAEPTLIPAAVEEMLRIEAPTQALPRTTTRDVEMHGVTIPADSRVMFLWGAANLDEREFPDAERFDVRRNAVRHLGFGHGIHFCLGAPLARLESRIAFEELLRRMPVFEVAEQPERFVSSWARAWRGLRLGPLAA